MPNATARANARTFPEATTHRAALGATTAFQAPPLNLSGADFRADLLWARYAELKERCDRLPEATPFDACQEAYVPLFAIARVLQSDIADSVLALGAALVLEIRDEEVEPLPGLFLACLAAIRPQLVGEIAKAADVLLNEEAAK